MLLSGSEKPCVVHIPSFNGFLSPRYGIQGNALDVINWRSNTVFNLSLKAINYIKYIDYYLILSNKLLIFDRQCGMLSVGIESCVSITKLSQILKPFPVPENIYYINFI